MRLPRCGAAVAAAMRWTAPCGISKQSKRHTRLAIGAACRSRSPIITAYTLSLDTPGSHGEGRRGSSARPLLKLKLGREGDVERLAPCAPLPQLPPHHRCQ